MVWNWAKVQKFLVTSYSDPPSVLCSLSSMDYIDLPNGISRFKKGKKKSVIRVSQKNRHYIEAQSFLYGKRLKDVKFHNCAPLGEGDIFPETEI